MCVCVRVCVCVCIYLSKFHIHHNVIVIMKLRKMAICGSQTDHKNNKLHKSCWSYPTHGFNRGFLKGQINIGTV